jgi:hypothetical protein
LITEHILTLVPSKSRPRLENTILFHGIHGKLRERVNQENAGAREAPPAFYHRCGRPFLVPLLFRQAAQLCLDGACCDGCHSCHLATTSRSEPKTDVVSETPTRILGGQLC